MRNVNIKGENGVTVKMGQRNMAWIEGLKDNIISSVYHGQSRDDVTVYSKTAEVSIFRRDENGKTYCLTIDQTGNVVREEVN